MEPKKGRRKMGYKIGKERAKGRALRGEGEEYRAARRTVARAQSTCGILMRNVIDALCRRHPDSSKREN